MGKLTQEILRNKICDLLGTGFYDMMIEGTPIWIIFHSMSGLLCEVKSGS